MLQGIMLPQAVSFDGHMMTAMTFCRLEGQSRIYNTVLNLLATLQHMCLVPCLDGEIYLSLFENFHDLQKIEVNVIYGYPAPPD